VRVNGRQQVFVPIYRQQGASSLDVADGVKAAIPEMEKELPEGSTLDFVVDQTEYVRKAIDSLVHEGIIGAILVSVMILVFLGNARMTFIATLSLPTLTGHQKRWSRILLRLGIGVVGIGVVALALTGDLPNPFRHTEAAATPAKDSENRTQVKVIRPKRETAVPITVDQIAAVEPYYRADLRACSSGIVKRVTKDIGNKVKKGEILVEIAYLDLVQVHAQIAINADTLEKATSMLKAAKDAQAAKLDRTAGDVQRAQTEVLFREQERIDLDGRAGAASARLGRFLLIPESVKLLPADAAVAPVTLIDASQSLKSLVALGVQNHPQLAANRAQLTAAWEHVALAKKAAILPKLAVVDQVGSFGGGLNDDLQNFDARNALGVQLFWELRNFGFGNRADIAQHRDVVDQRNYQLLDSQARLVAEIVDAAQIAKAKASSLGIAEQAVKEATELYRIAKEGTFNVIDAKNLFDALRPLQAIQTLNQARLNYLATVIDYNRAQYRLFTALGHAPKCAVAR
jgi:hypothetical protein